jgi:hypothetical protein
MAFVSIVKGKAVSLCWVARNDFDERIEYTEKEMDSLLKMKAFW